MKFPIGTKIYAIFNGKVSAGHVKAQSRQYKEFIRLHLYDDMLVNINGHQVPMIVDLHPDDVYEDRMIATKILFERKLKGQSENTYYEMNNLELIREVAYQERIHRELHGVEHAKPYLEVLRKAASVGHVEGIFADVTFNKYGLAEGGPFVKLHGTE